MSTIEFLKKRFQKHLGSVALVAKGEEITYEQLSYAVNEKISAFENTGIGNGHVVVLKGDYSLNSISSLLALLDLNCIIVPITPTSFEVLESSIEEVAPQFLVDCTLAATNIDKYQAQSSVPALYKILHSRVKPGLVLFTSGSSGKPKVVVHDFSKLLEKFHALRPALKTLNFLLFDHWGGLNTLLHGLSLPSSNARRAHA